jgi:ribosomal protein L11 methyltransferase
MTAPPNCLRIAPRVLLHELGSPPPVLEPGELALPQLPPSPGAPAVFGDGRHPTTRLCAAALDLVCRQQPGAAVLDVGTGTGVLARIARARRARLVSATDIDPRARSLAHAHAALDDHPLPIQISAESPDRCGERFDLVVANILEAPLCELAPALRAALLPGGRLLISGFTRPQVPALSLAFERAGFSGLISALRDNWVLLSFRAP